MIALSQEKNIILVLLIVFINIFNELFCNIYIFYLNFRFTHFDKCFCHFKNLFIFSNCFTVLVILAFQVVRLIFLIHFNFISINEI